MESNLILLKDAIEPDLLFQIDKNICANSRINNFLDYNDSYLFFNTYLKR